MLSDWHRAHWAHWAHRSELCAMQQSLRWTAGVQLPILSSSKMSMIWAWFSTTIPSNGVGDLWMIMPLSFGAATSQIQQLETLQDSEIVCSPQIETSLQLVFMFRTQNMRCSGLGTEKSCNLPRASTYLGFDDVDTTVKLCFNASHCS